MLCDLNWSTLQHHREVSRLKTFHNVIYNTSALKMPHYFVITTYTTHHQEPVFINIVIFLELFVIGTIYLFKQLNLLPYNYF